MRGHASTGIEAARAFSFMVLRRCGRWSEERRHALLHLAGHVVVPHQRAAVAQTARLPLHHEHPERVAGFPHQEAPGLLRCFRARMSGIELPQPGEGLFQRTSHSPKRGRLLFGELIRENVDGNTIKAKITGHPISPGSLRNADACLLAAPAGCQ